MMGGDADASSKCVLGVSNGNIQPEYLLIADPHLFIGLLHLTLFCYEHYLISLDLQSMTWLAILWWVFWQKEAWKSKTSQLIYTERQIIFSRRQFGQAFVWGLDILEESLDRLQRFIILQPMLTTAIESDFAFSDEKSAISEENYCEVILHE